MPDNIYISNRLTYKIVFILDTNMQYVVLILHFQPPV